jgi:hypothetical protein
MTEDADNPFLMQALRPRRKAIIFSVLLLVTIALFIYSFSGPVKTLDAGRFSALVWEGELTLRLFSAESITGNVQQVQGAYFLGLGFYRLTYVTGYSYSIACPLWLLMIIFGVSLIYEAIRLLRLRRSEQRRRAGLCSCCGYDLRAGHEICPECGAAAPIGARISWDVRIVIGHSQAIAAATGATKINTAHLLAALAKHSRDSELLAGHADEVFRSVFGERASSAPTQIPRGGRMESEEELKQLIQSMVKEALAAPEGSPARSIELADVIRVLRAMPQSHAYRVLQRCGLTSGEPSTDRPGDEDEQNAWRAAPDVLNYPSPRRRRPIPWYHWIPLAVLIALLVFLALVFLLHQHDATFWDI